MTGMYVVIAIGILLIGLTGFIGKRRPSASMADWTVGGRRFGAWTTWFLQAGEIFTTFTFLGLAGLVFAGGVAVSYVPGYLAIGYIGLFLLAPLFWRVAKRHGYLTNSDFLTHRFNSPVLGRLSAVLGVVFLLPYLQLQVTGLGLIVKLTTGNDASSTVGMIVAVVLVAGFVLWAGIRGVAVTSYLKDALMLIVLGVLIVGVPLAFGGHGEIFPRVQQLRPELLTLHAGTFDQVWFFTSMLVSALGLACMTLPYMWQGVLAARSGQALRRNYALLPVYTIALFLPVVVGFVAVMELKTTSNPDASLLTITKDSLPGWLVGLVVVGGAATAMVPSAAMVIGMSALVANNILPSAVGDRTRFRVGRGAVVVVLALALLLALVRPALLANLLLLTYSGLVQLAPGNLLGLTRRRPRSGLPVILGIVVGEAVVIWLTFSDVAVAHINVGIIGLLANLVVLLAAWAVTGRRVADHRESASVPAQAG